MLDFDITRCSRKCSATGRTILPGEDVYSVLLQDGGDIVRRDYAANAWEGPPEACLGWWATQIPKPPNEAQKMAPPEVLVGLFDQLSQTDQKAELRFILALLLIRKKLLKEEASIQESASNHWRLKCPMNETVYELESMRISASQASRLQEELVDLLYGGVPLDADASNETDEVLESTPEDDSEVA